MMSFININPLSHVIKWKVVKLVQFRNYKGGILKKTQKDLGSEKKGLVLSPANFQPPTLCPKAFCHK